MQQNSFKTRWPLIIWLILSQLGSLSLIFLPTIILLTLGSVSLEAGGLSVLPGLACIGPLLVVTLSGTAWVAYARREDKQALVLTSIVLIIGALMHFGIDFYTRYVNP